MTVTLDSLKTMYRTYIKHSRFYNIEVEVAGLKAYYTVGPFSRSEASRYGYTSKEINARGGKTEIEIYDGENAAGYAVANCSIKDPYVKKLGVQIALGRLEKTMSNASTVNWSEVIDQIGVSNMQKFCSGDLTRRELESYGGASRRVIRQLGTKEMRTRARQALQRRLTTAAATIAPTTRSRTTRTNCSRTTTRSSCR